MAQVKEGTDFQELIETVSTLPGQSGSDLGYVSRGELMPQLEQAIWDLKPGEVTMVRTHLGYHVVQVTDHKIHTLENDPQIRQQIENILFQQKFNQQSQKWMEDLRKQATIEILP
jgi:parvulin-like peptidyl-prolyl isomerase